MIVKRLPPLAVALWTLALVLDLSSCTGSESPVNPEPEPTSFTIPIELITTAEERGSLIGSTLTLITGTGDRLVSVLDMTLSHTFEVKSLEGVFQVSLENPTYYTQKDTIRGSVAAKGIAIVPIPRSYRRVPVDIRLAFQMIPLEEQETTQPRSFLPRGGKEGRLDLRSPRTQLLQGEPLKVALNHLKPPRDGLQYSNGVWGRISSADSIAIWTALRSMEDTVSAVDGRQITLFRPVRASEIIEGESAILISWDQLSTQIAHASALPDSRWIYVVTCGISLPGDAIRRTRTIQHESMHCLGVGHTSAWVSVMWKTGNQFNRTDARYFLWYRERFELYSGALQRYGRVVWTPSAWAVEKAAFGLE